MYQPEEDLPVKKKKFRLFDSQREGKGIKKEDILNLKPNLRGFFTYLRRDFSRLISINMLMVIGNFPIFFAILAFSGVGNEAYSAPIHSLFSTLYGTTAGEGLNAANVSLLSIQGLQTTLYSQTTVTYVLYALSALTLITLGPINIGSTYVMRNMLRGEPVFLFSDFRYAIKRNFKQGLIAGIIDTLALVLLVGDIAILLSSGSNVSGLLVGVIFVFFLVYLFMRPYVYLQIVTFDLKLFKILKNALIFAILGIKRNVMALLGVICLLILCIFMLFGLYGALIPIGLALTVALFAGLSGYMFIYAAYFKVKEIMIDPYVTKTEELQEKPILTDRG